MIRLDRMLMIGSAGANVGKTELACAILKKFASQTEIVGIKVTTIKETEGPCPRGGEGCGMCSSLDGVFLITEETDRDSGKDTSRLLAAGAEQVFWLRVLSENLSEGASALLEVIGRDVVCVCESNSLRKVIEPGLFLVVRGLYTRAWKDSASEVREYAQKVVVSDGSAFDLDLDRIELIDGKWRLRDERRRGSESLRGNATAIVMAGGESRRMGVDKSLLRVGGQPMIERICEQLRGHFDEILISANEPEKLAFLGLKVVPDRVRGQGPLMGIASALEASRNELNFVVACDIPQIDVGLVESMLAEARRSGADVVIPTASDQRHEPLYAIYRKSVLDAANQVLAAGGRKIAEIFDLCRVEYFYLSDAKRLANLNTQAEYEEFRKRCGD